MCICIFKPYILFNVDINSSQHKSVQDRVEKYVAISNFLTISKTSFLNFIVLIRLMLCLEQLTFTQLFPVGRICECVCFS